MPGDRKGILKMEKLKAPSVVLCLLLGIAPVNSFGQRRKRVLICKNRAFARLRPLPELSYQCPANVASESDDRILKSPERIEARTGLIRELSSLTDPGWWEALVEDLNLCDVRGKPGQLNAEEKEKYTDPERQPRLLGNNRIRLVVAPDPCYQTYYNGANLFLLYRNGGKVYVTEVLDGYYSRLANSISMRFLRLGGEQVIEISTVNLSGMRPDTSRYYFVIDRATKKAKVKKLSSRGWRGRSKS
jgi:hypothetical protein